MLLWQTEDQWYLLLESTKHKLSLENQKGNLDLKEFASPCPVDLYKNGDFFDSTGNIWQWTRTPIYPFEGFKVHELYKDFTTPTFDDRHNLMKGGSFISTGNEADSSSIYAFRRHFYQHAGCRYIEELS